MPPVPLQVEVNVGLSWVGNRVCCDRTEVAVPRIMDLHQLKKKTWAGAGRVGHVHGTCRAPCSCPALWNIDSHARLHPLADYFC